jgi:hypothetical protein
MWNDAEVGEGAHERGMDNAASASGGWQTCGEMTGHRNLVYACCFAHGAIVAPG